MILCGKYPLEYYGGGDPSEYNFMDQSAFVGFIAVAVVLAILYVLPFIFSKKLRPGWLLFTLVIFILDTLFMLIDNLFHIWVIVSLFIGVSAGYKLKKLPSEEEEQPQWEQPVSCTNTFED